MSNSKVTGLPDCSAFGGVSFPLPKDHWLTQDHENVPPAPFKNSFPAARRHMEKALYEAGKYALRCATDNGRIIDFDPDALLQNLVIGFLGSREVSLLKSTNLVCNTGCE